MKFPRFKSRWQRYFFVGGLLLFSLPTALMGLLQTPFAKAWICRYASNMLSEATPFEVTVRGLTGFLPFSAGLEHFSLADEQGTWLSAQGASIRISVGALSRDPVRAKVIRLASLEIRRMPVAGETAPRQTTPLHFPAVPEAPSWLRVEKLTLEKIRLGAPVLGEAMTLRAQGRYEPEPPGPVLRLQITRLDGPGGKIDLDAVLGKQDLQVDLSVEEERFVGGILGMEGPFLFSLHGRGPLGKWQGRAQAALGGEAIMKTRFRLDYGAALGLRAEGRMNTTHPLVPNQARKALSNTPLDFKIDARLTEDRVITVRTLSLMAAPLELKGEGTVNLAGGLMDLAFKGRFPAGSLNLAGRLDLEEARLEGRFQADILDATAFGTLLPMALAGKGTITAEMKGGREGINATLGVKVKDMAIGEVTIASSSLRFDVHTGWLDEPMADFGITGGGDVLGVRPPGFEAQDISLKVAMETIARKDLRVRRAIMVAPWGKAEVRGMVNLDTRAADLSAALDLPRLAPLLALAGLQGSGSVNAALRIQSNAPWPTVTTETHISAVDLTGLPGEMAGLLGGRVTIDASGVLRGKEATLRNMAVESPNLSFAGKGLYQLDTRHLQARLEGDVVDLSPLTPLLGHPAGGRAEYTARVRGPLDAMTAEFTLDVSSPVLGQASFETLHLETQASGLPRNPSGNLVLSGTRGESRIEGRARLTSDEDHWTVHELALRAGPNRIDGKADFNVASHTGASDLKVTLPDLSYMGRLTNMALAGAITGRIRLDGKDGIATVRAALEGTGLETPYGTVAAMNCDAQLRGPANLTLSRFSIHVKDMTFNQVHVARLQTEAHGTLADGIALNGRFQGAVPGNIPLDLIFGGTLSEGGSTLGLAKLEGNLGHFPFALASPATLTWHEGRGSIALDTFALGEGRLGIHGSYGPDIIDLNAEWEHLPLSLMALYRDMPVSGSVEGSLSVRGTPTLPRFALAARVRDLRGAGMEDLNAAVDTSIEATLGEDLLSGEVTARLPDALTLNLAVSTHTTLRMEPFLFALSPDQPIKGALQLDSDLASTLKPFHLTGQEIAGRAKADLTLGGTLAVPTLTGTATVANGSYFNDATGTALQGLDLLLKANGRRAVIERLHASDPVGGGIEGTGKMNLSPENRFAYSLRLRLEQFRLADRDDFTGLVSGGLAFEGTAEDAAVTGDIVLGPAAIRVSGQFPPAQLTPVAIEMPGEKGVPPEEEASGFADHVSLDLHVSSPGRVVLTAPVLDTEWKCNLRVLGTAADPRLDGSLSIVRGNMDFLGRRFDLTESTITFDKSGPPDPFLDIKAESRANDITARLNLNGTMDHLDIGLSSAPPFPEDEVLARILFGTSLSDITPVQALQLVRVADMLRSGGSGGSLFAGDVRSPRLDHFEVKPGGASGETSVVVGQYITDKIYVEAEQGRGRDASKVQVKARISPQFSVEGSAESTGGNGLGFFWKYDY